MSDELPSQERTVAESFWGSVVRNWRKSPAHLWWAIYWRIVGVWKELCILIRYAFSPLP